MIHVDMNQDETFCGREIEGLDHVPLATWSESPESVQIADCTECLLKLFMLGDSARIKVERMGMKIEVKDVPGEEMMS